MTNNNSIAINPNDDFYAIAADANARLDSMLESVSEMGEISEDAHKRLEEMVNKVKSLKDSLDKKTKAKNERPISLKESKSTDMIPTTAVVKDAAPSVDKVCNDPYENDTQNAKSGKHETLQSNPNNEHDSIKGKYDALISGACDWDAPKFNKDMLRRSTSDVYDDLDKSRRKKYAKYNLCIKDIKRNKSAYTNVISIIARNTEDAISLSDFTKAINEHKLLSENSFINSGLFIYKSSDDELISSTFEPDSYLELWIPLDVEKELILSSDYHVTHRVGYGSPILSGVIMSFNNMKKLLLDPKVIVSPSLANTKGLYEDGTVLHRDISTNNYWYQDIFMSNDVICKMYSL